MLRTVNNAVLIDLGSPRFQFDSKENSFEFAVIVVDVLIVQCNQSLTTVNLDSKIKLPAKIRQRQIIVHDANRIHHFHPNGEEPNQVIWECLVMLMRFL